MIAGIPRETTPGEKRVSLVPENISKLSGVQITMERGAGDPAGYPDSAYVEKGARIADDARSLYGAADLVLKVMPPTPSEAGALKEGSTLISFRYPVANIETVMSARELAERAEIGDPPIVDHQQAVGVKARGRLFVAYMLPGIVDEVEERAADADARHGPP